MNDVHRAKREEQRKTRRAIRAQLRRACMDVVQRREHRAALRAFNGHTLASQLRAEA